ncbi:MAG: alpha-N-arabinofuranosidase [Lachnospiraceae bacterium]
MKRLVVNPLNKKGKIEKEVYGHFSEHLGRCIYEGLYVGEDSPIANEKGIRKDVVEALKAMGIPVLRWPGGCFADEYHWKDGIGPKEERKKIVNTHWGGVTEDNSFGTHEFMELCDQLGCEAYINGNLGSGTVREMSEWVEYLTSDAISPMTELRKKNGREKAWDVKYFGVGNENWGCGGNMNPDFYANEFRRYSTYCRIYDENRPLYKIACGPNTDDYKWTEGLMKTLQPDVKYNGHVIDGISLHYYTVPNTWDDKGSATEFDVEEYYRTLEKTLYMDELISRHSDIMNQYDPKKELGLIVDEWGTWYNVEPGTNPGFLYQQNTMRDAIVAGLNLNIFHKHADRVKMANIAQLVNVLQSVILTEGEKMILTPTYYVFRMLQKHQGSMAVETCVESEEIGAGASKVPCLSESASIAEDGSMNLTVVNLSAEESYEVKSILVETQVHEVEAEILTDKIDAYNTFEEGETVKAEPFTDYTITEKGVSFTIPPCSVLQFTIR